MKKTLLSFGIVLLLVGVFSPVFVNAQQSNYEACIQAGFDQIDCSNIPDRDAPAEPEVQNGGWFDILGYLAKALGYIAYLILQIMSLLLELSGRLLNFVLGTTIVEMSENISKMTGINTAWKVIRDLMNLAFIWILVYEAIKLIIGQSTTDAIKKMITGIVLASILINFSLFFTKLLIDASNIVTIGFYNAIVGEENLKDPQNKGLSDTFQQSLGLQGWFSNEGVKKFENITKGGDDYTMLVIGLMASILFLITTFVFLAVSVMFVVRYIVLVILLMLAPIGYMGMAFPSMQKHASTWWSSLNGQLLFAPVYMVMTWVVMTLMTSPNFVINPEEWVGLAGSNLANSDGHTASIALLFNFVVVIGLAIASLVISKGFATQGASQIGKFTGDALKFTGNALMGNASKVGRATIGRAGNFVANSDKLKDMAVSKNIFARKAGQWALTGGDKAAKSAFDIRNAKIGGFGVSNIADFGKGADTKKVSFQKDLEAKSKSEVDFAKMLKGKSDDSDIEKLEEQKKAFQEEAKNAAIGTEKFRLQEEAKRVGREIEELKKKTRVAKYAETFEKENAGWRYTKNIFKIPLGAVSSLSPTTHSDNLVIAKAIRKGDKSKKEKFADLAAEIAREGAESVEPPPTPPTT